MNEKSSQSPDMPSEKMSVPPGYTILLRILFAIVGVLSMAWLMLTWQLVSRSVRQQAGMSLYSEAQEKYHDAYLKASHLLKRGSDTLTETARRYVVTGDRAHLDSFFAEADGTRSRNRALELVDGLVNVSEETGDILHTAMTRSNSLFDQECHAMHLFAAAQGISDDGLPVRLSSTPLPPEEAALSPDEKRSLARKMLFDDEYFAAKAEIWDLVNEFIDKSMEEQMAKVREEGLAARRSAIRQTSIITIRLVVLFLLLLAAVGAMIVVFVGKNRSYAKLAEDLRHERDATIAAEKAKSMFFSMVSHDIRTPLNSIIGYSEMLADGVGTDEERAENARNVSFSAYTLLALVNDVLDLSKLDADKMTIVPVSCDFRTLLLRIAASFRMQAEDKGISMRAFCPPMPRLMLDEDRIRQILMNLAGNAVKFTHNGGVELHATFEPGGSGQRGTLRMAVRDTGIGIAPEDQQRILEPFVQVGMGGVGNGTGLGLTICKRLLERMGGSIQIESKLGFGSTFTAVIPDVAIVPGTEPVGAVVADDKGVRPDAAAAAAGDGAEAKAGARRRVESVLVVDDVPVNAKVERAMLQRAGISDVETATSGGEALALLHHRRFDLVLTDLWMPNMDGYELCSAIRSDPDPAISHVRVHAVSADVEARKSVRNRGFDGILIKPVTYDVLTRFLETV